MLALGFARHMGGLWAVSYKIYKDKVADADENEGEGEDEESGTWKVED